MAGWDEDGSGEYQGMPDPTAGLGQQPYIPTYGPAQGIDYGDNQAYQTQLRAGYGNNPLFAMGGFGGGGGGGGGYQGGGGAFGALGANIAPIRYTPPAMIITGYSGRYAQQTGIMADLKNLAGLGPQIRGARDYDISQNAASDLGERAGLSFGGAALSVGEGVFGALASSRMGLVGGFGVYMAAGKFTDQVRQAVSERREVQGYLENNSDRFFSTSAMAGQVDPRRGTGMSTKSRQDVGEFMRQMDTADPMMNMQDLTQVMKKSVEAGMFTGTQSVDDFKKKFKDIVENVKLVTTTLHQTLEEGVKTLKDLRSIGIDPSNAKGALMSAEIMGRASGKSAGEMMNIGLQGAELFRGTGVSMEIGFQANMMNTASIRALRDSKTISQETIAQAGGEEALAQRMTATGLGFSQSTMGRGLAGAYFGGAGASGSGFNEEAFRKFAGGGMGIGDIAGQAAKNLGNPAAIIKFQAHQEEFVSEMGKQFGGQGLQINMMASAMPLAQQLAQHTGSNVKDAYKLVLTEKFGVDEQTAKTMMGSITGAQGIFDSKQRSTQQTMNDQLIQNAGQNFFFSRIANELGDAWKKGVIDPIARPLNKVVDGAKESVHAFNEEHMYGIRRASTTGIGHGAYVGSATAADIAAASSDDKFLVKGPDGKTKLAQVNLDEGGMFSATPGSDLLKSARNREDSSLYKLDLYTAADGNPKANVRLGHDYDGNVKYTTLSSLERNTKIANVTARTMMQAEAAETAGELNKVLPGVSKKMQTLLTSGKKYKNLDELSLDVYGKKVGDLGKGSAEYDAMMLVSKTSPSLTKLFDEARDEGSTYIAGTGRKDVEYERGLVETVKKSSDELTELITPSTLLEKAGVTDKKKLTPEMIGQLAEINKLRGSWKGADIMRLEEVKDAFKAATMKVDGPGGEALRASADTYIDRAMSGDRHITDLLTAGGDAQRKLDANQRVLGGKVLTDALEKEIYGGSSKITSPAERAKLESLVKKLALGGAQDVAKLDPESTEGKLLAKTSVGNTLVTEAATLQTMKAFGDGLGPAELKEKLKGYGSKEQIDQIADEYQKGGRHISAAMETYHAQTMDKLAGDNHLSVAGASAGVGVATGSPQDTAAVQTNINAATLNIMLSLAKSLGQGVPGAK
jgi:hypothetical protein